jgi:hypothetical protein
MNSPTLQSYKIGFLQRTNSLCGYWRRRRLPDSSVGPNSDAKFPNGPIFTHNYVDDQLICLISVIPIDVLTILNLIMDVFNCWSCLPYNGKQKQKGQWTYLLFSYNLQIYKQCTKIEYTPNFISDNQFKHCYNIKNCTDCGENSWYFHRKCWNDLLNFCFFEKTTEIWKSNGRRR